MDGHRVCICGSYPELVGTFYSVTCYVHCPNCGARAKTEKSPFRAWLAWDNKQLEDSDENYTIWEALE